MVSVNPEECYLLGFGRYGHLSSVVKELAGKELTVIVHMKE